MDTKARLPGSKTGWWSNRKAAGRLQPLKHACRPLLILTLVLNVFCCFNKCDDLIRFELYFGFFWLCLIQRECRMRWQPNHTRVVLEDAVEDVWLVFVHSTNLIECTTLNAMKLASGSRCCDSFSHRRVWVPSKCMWSTWAEINGNNIYQQRKLESNFPGPRSEIMDPGSRIPDPGSWILNDGSRILDPGTRRGFRIQDRRFSKHTKKQKLLNIHKKTENV